MARKINYTKDFYESLSSLIDVPVDKIEAYSKDHNLFNILEHPMVINPNVEQLKKINMLNNFISSYKLLRLEEENSRIKLEGVGSTGRYFASLLGGIRDKELFCVAFLDNSSHIIETKVMSEGDVERATVYPREVLATALANDCAKIVLAHNHPSGLTSASFEDKRLTQTFVNIFDPLGIKVHDHIIVGGHSFSSMAQNGIMPGSAKGIADYRPVLLSPREMEDEDELDDEYEMD